MKRLNINGIAVQYLLEGKAERPPLVLIHGFPFGLGLWKAQVAVLKRKFRVLSYDLRGMGKSSSGPLPQPLETYVDDLFLLLDRLDLKFPALCGLSMGGYIALRAVQKTPERFSKLVLCSTRADADTNAGKLKRAGGIQALHSTGAAAYSRAMLPNLLAPATIKGRPEVAKGLLKLMLGNTSPGMANALAAMAGRTDTSDVLGTLKMPVLVMAGSEDTLIPREVSQGMAAAIEGAKFLVIPGAGHVCNLDAPLVFNRFLSKFLEREFGPGAGKMG